MTGEQLYAMYVEEMLKQEIGVDEWNQIEVADQAAWNAMAARLETWGTK